MSDSRQRKRVRIRHRRKLFDGRYTAEEVHTSFAFPPHAQCQGCERPPTMRIIVMAPLDEMRKRNPEFDTVMELDPSFFMQQLVKIRENPTDEVGKPYVKVSVVYACKRCTPRAEKAAAKAPSWCIVEINKGPGPDNPIVGVA